MPRDIIPLQRLNMGADAVVFADMFICDAAVTESPMKKNAKALAALTDSG
jgi:hypothetical protein